MPQAETDDARHRQQQLNRIAEAVTSGSEKRLLNALTKAAAELTGMPIALITVIDEDGYGTVTAAFPRDTGLVGYRYYIPSSPCAFSIEEETLVISSGLAAAYPSEPIAAAAGLQAYVGRRLVDNEGQALGVFAVMDNRPIEDNRELLSVLEVLAARAAAELQREQTHNRLLQQEARLNVALENGEQLIWEWEVESDRYLVYEPATVDFEHFATTGEDRMRLVHPEDAQRVTDARKAYFRGEQPVYEYEARYLAPQGDYRWIFVRGKASERFADGRVRRLMGTHTDITALKAAEQAHANSRALLTLVLDTVPQFVYWKDRDSVYQGANRRFAEFTGINDPEKLIGMTDADLWWGDQAADVRARDLEVIDGRVRQMRMERELETPRGEQRWFEITRAPMRAADGTITGMLGSMHDITERKSAENEAQRLALYDPLTELPNRRYLIERLRTAIAAAERHEGRGAVLFIDLDQFKQINDSLGHAVGDQLLRIVARRLRKVTRREDMVARLGGDEFVVLLPSVDREPHAAALQSELTAEKVSEVLVEQYLIGNISKKTVGSSRSIR